MAWLIDKAVDLRGLGAAPVELITAYVGDTNAYTWRVTVTEGGAAKDLTGYSVVLQFLRIADASEIDATGTISGNVATLVIPQACFAYAGVCGAVMRLVKSSTGENTPISGLTFAIRDLHSGTVVDPGDVVPDLSALLAQMESIATAEAGRVSAESTRAAFYDGFSSQLAEIGKLEATNKLSTGNFASLSNWSTVAASLAVAGNVATIRATAQYGGIYQTISKITGHKYYAYALVKGAATRILMLLDGSVFASSIVSISNTYQRLYLAWTATSDGSMQIKITDTGTSGYADFFVQYAAVLDLTAIFGAGKEPSDAQMEAYLAYWPNGWFDGTVNLAAADKALPALIEARKLLVAPESITPTLINGWTAFSSETAPKFFKDVLGFVHVQGVAKSGAMSQPIMVLPVGYRPDRTVYFSTVSNGLFGYGYVDYGGQVFPFVGNNAWFALGSIPLFKAV